MGKLERDGRVIVAEGGSCPSLERLGNGDLLVAYRDDTFSKLCVSVTRSTDCGRTWRKEHTFAYGASAERTDEQFYGHHGMAQLADGTILLPYNVYGATYSGVYNRTVCVRRSVDQGHTWSEPIVVVPGPGPACRVVVGDLLRQDPHPARRDGHPADHRPARRGRPLRPPWVPHLPRRRRDLGALRHGRLRPLRRRRSRLPAAPGRPHPVREPRSLQHPRSRGRTAVLQLE